MSEVIQGPPRILYIGGTGRSGTNFLKSLLSQHEKVFALPFEHRAIIDPGGLVDFYHRYSSAWSPYMADAKVRELRTFLEVLGRKSTFGSLLEFLLSIIPGTRRKLAGLKYSGWELQQTFPNYNEALNELMEELEHFSFSGRWPGTPSLMLNPTLSYSAPMEKKELAKIIGKFIDKIVVGCLHDNEKEIFVEDNTWNILFAIELLEFNPQAKLIHIFRNPRDVVASFLMQSWAPNNLDQAIRWYLDIIGHWFKVKNDLPEGRFSEVRFEDLIENPQVELSRLGAFAEIEFKQFSHQISKEKANIGRWKEDFSAKEKSILQEKLTQIEKKLGY